MFCLTRSTISVCHSCTANQTALLAYVLSASQHYQNMSIYCTARFAALSAYTNAGLLAWLSYQCMSVPGSVCIYPCLCKCVFFLCVHVWLHALLAYVSMHMCIIHVCVHVYTCVSVCLCISRFCVSSCVSLYVCMSL